MIREFKEDAIGVSALIARTLGETNIRDYTEEFIENDVKIVTPEYLIQNSYCTHSYDVCDEDKIIVCGSIGPYWGKEDESSLLRIFVLPEYQGQGIGRKIIETLENDDYYMRAKKN